MNIQNIVLKELSLIKHEAELNAELNLKNAMQIEEFKNCYNQIRSLQFEIAKCEFSNKNSNNLKNELIKQKENLKQIMQQNNINSSLFKPNYNCKICKDTGKINGEFCSCFKQLLSKRLLQESGLNVDILPDFDNMCYNIVKNEQHRVAYIKAGEILKKYVEKLGVTDKKIILLSGNVGVGKTYLLKATANEAIKNNHYTLYTTAFDLNKTFLKYHCAKLDEKEDILNNYINCDLLLIDDLGTENILKNVTIEYLYLILNQRLELNKNTIITTNLNLDELKNTYDERIISRIANKKTSVITTLQGDDLRIN